LCGDLAFAAHAWNLRGTFGGDACFGCLWQCVLRFIDLALGSRMAPRYVATSWASRLAPAACRD
jgi:hypothetical protein